MMRGDTPENTDAERLLFILSVPLRLALVLLLVVVWRVLWLLFAAAAAAAAGAAAAASSAAAAAAAAIWRLWCTHAYASDGHAQRHAHLDGQRKRPRR